MPEISSDNAVKVERLLLKNIRKLTKKKIGQIYETVVIALLFFSIAYAIYIRRTTVLLMAVSLVPKKFGKYL